MLFANRLVCVGSRSFVKCRRRRRFGFLEMFVVPRTLCNFVLLLLRCVMSSCELYWGVMLYVFSYDVRYGVGKECMMTFI